MPERRPSYRLAVYLAALVTLALLPLGVISLVQTRTLLADADRMAHNAVQARTVAAAMQERSVLHTAAGAARALGTAQAIQRLDPAQCSRMMESFITGQESFVFAGFIEPGGMMRCSSTGEQVDFSEYDSYKNIIKNPRLSYVVSRSGAVTKASVIIVTQPIFVEGELAGFVSISTPHQLSLELADPELIEQGVTIALVSLEGEILAANRDIDTVPPFLPPQDVKYMVIAQPGQTYSGLSLSGEERIFAVTPLLNDQIVIIGSWPKQVALANADTVTANLTLITPIVMWLVGLAVALWGLHRLVIRHLEALRSALRRFALGERFEGLELNADSQEFRYIQTAFNRMMVLVREGEVQSERDLQEKTLLLREVHHRVKNNLQLIASIMNMQARNANTPEARRLLAQLQRRVRGLAMVHHTLNAKSKLITVDTATLIERLVTELAQRTPIKGHTIDVRTDVVSVELGQDQSVTLSMLVAEALTNAVKYVGLPEGGRPMIRVELTRVSERELQLLISNTRGEMDLEEGESELTANGGIGQRLMQAFVSQLDAEFEIVETDDLYEYRVTFPIEDTVADEPPALAAGDQDKAAPSPQAAG